MSNNVIVLPGTRWQIPLIQKLKARGYYVIVLDYYENQPAYEYGDEHSIVNILDKERVLEIARKYNVQAVMSDECDIATPTIAWVSEQLGKPSIGMEMAELYTNKYRMREFSRENGFAVPFFCKCYCLEDAIAAMRNFGGKMIMKPLDANSSRGIFSVESEKDIILHYSETEQYSKLETCVLLEEYIEGEEFSIDAIKIGEIVYPMAISQKIHFTYNENLDQSLLFRNQSDEFDYDLLRKVNEDYIKKTGLSFGLTHAEYKLNNGIYYLIEIGVRGGGNQISSVINPFLTGIQSQELLIDWAVGNALNDQVRYDDHFENRCARMFFFDTEGKAGILKEIVGKEWIAKLPEIKSFHFFYSEGDSVGMAKDGGTRLGYYIACADSVEELERIEGLIAENVKIIIV